MYFGHSHHQISLETYLETVIDRPLPQHDEKHGRRSGNVVETSSLTGTASVRVFGPLTRPEVNSKHHEISAIEASFHIRRERFIGRRRGSKEERVWRDNLSPKEL